MKALSHKSREKGMALLVAMFTLVLLSVIGLGLMYSTNMETIINANYRDKQVSMYGALSGLQEARDRLQPAAPSMPLPTDMPTLTNYQVFYIINPKGGETVAPWDLTNKYKDTELCQEGILGLTPTPGAPCNELPMGDDWYTVIDNSDDANEPWKSTTPLDTKWIRVTMKANNMTPVLASGTAVSTQTCWEGAHQVLLPDGYGPDCGPDGSIVKVRVTAGGTGYSSPPTVTFSAPPAGGTLATGTATITPLASGQLSSITVDTPGAGYTTPPSVSFVGTGSGATATAEIVPSGAPVSTVTLVSAGQQCYAVPPTVSFSGGGSGATATATLEGTNSCVAAWTVTGSCFSRRGTTVTGVGLSGASGSGFSGSITFRSGSGNVIATSIEDPGVGFTSNPTTLTDLTGCGSLTVTAVAGARLASPLTLDSGGAGYTTTPTVNVASGAGTAVAPASATATLGASVVGGTVSAIHLNTPGTGYTTPPLVVLTGGGVGVTTIATATANLDFTNKVTDIVLTDRGLGYTYNPTVTISGGGGTGATATASRANGSDYGRIFLVTSMSQTRSGARSMAQAELASPVSGAWFPGALTLNGPNPNIDDLPNSDLFEIDGDDKNSCLEDKEDLRPAIGGYDDPNADPPTASVPYIVSELPRPDHYTGLGGAPSVVNIFGSLGETMSTPTGLKAFIDAVAAAPGAHVYGSDPPSIDLGSAAHPAINYIEGDLTLSGLTTGHGILVVTGTLSFSGNFLWNGLILAVGDGVMEYGGGGNAEINGSVFVAKIWDSYTTKNLLPTLGSPSFDWNGGGGNGIYYDHCYVENLIPIVPFTPPPSTKPLKVLSTRTVSY